MTKRISSPSIEQLDTLYVKVEDWFVMPPADDWHDPTGGLPADPDVGDRYVSDATAEGWEIDHIYEWDGSEWVESEPEEGWMIWMLFELMFYVFFSGGWMEVGSATFVEKAGDIMTGQLTFTGDGRVKKEIRIGAGIFHKGVSAPDDVYLTNNVHVLAFDKAIDQHGHYSTKIPLDYAAGTNIDIEVDWAFANVEAGHYVTWGLEYLLLADGEDPAGVATTRLQKSVISTGNNDKQIRTVFETGITGATADDTLLIRFYRDADHATDDDLDQDAWLLTVHLHYISDKLGEAV